MAGIRAPVLSSKVFLKRKVSSEAKRNGEMLEGETEAYLESGSGAIIAFNFGFVIPLVSLLEFFILLWD